MRESLILEKVMQYLERRGDCLAWRNNTGAIKVGDRFLKFGSKGSADVLGVWAPAGRFIAVETKSTKGAQSISQKKWQARFEMCGGLYVLAKTIAPLEAALGQPRLKLPDLYDQRVFYGAVDG